jgi:hypothetical protein
MIELFTIETNVCLFPDLLFFFIFFKLLLSKFENDAKASFIIYFYLELHLPSGGGHRTWTRSVQGRGSHYLIVCLGSLENLDILVLSKNLRVSD